MKQLKYNDQQTSNRATTALHSEIKSLYLLERPDKGYKLWLRYALQAFMAVLTACLFQLIMYWNPEMYAKLMFARQIDAGGEHGFTIKREGNREETWNPIEDVNECVDQLKGKMASRQITHVLLKDNNDELHIIELTLKDGNALFEFRYVWYEFQSDEFSYGFKPIVFDFGMQQNLFCQQFGQGIQTEQEVAYLQDRFGKCEIKIKRPSVLGLLFHEVLSPFYIFQLFSIFLWLFDGYVLYAGCIAVIATLSIISEIYDAIVNANNIRERAEHKMKTIKVMREGREQTISSCDLVPGDLAILDEAQVLPCDLILLSGQCVLNESNLTGESVPVVKSPISAESNQLINPNDDSLKMHTLYAGSSLLQAQQDSFGVVIKIGFQTTKGNLIRDILYPLKISFRFVSDSYVAVLLMACVSVFGFAITIPTLAKYGFDWVEIAVRSLDLVTIAIPPALPAILATSIAFTIQRLQKNQIFCISPNRINLCGRIQTFVFDKTGTLTEDSLQVVGHQSAKDKEDKELLSAMAACHSLTQLHGEGNEAETQLIGDVLDIEMFKYVTSNGLSVRLDGERIEVDGEQIEILKCYQFDSKLQRMGVVVKERLDDGSCRLRSIVKGSPEKILELCRAESLPEDFQRNVDSLTQQGKRVIAVAQRSIESDLANLDYEQDREQIESDLQLLGLLIMDNYLKPASSTTITELKKCKIRTLMATGDNILTAISVAKKCNIIEDAGVVYFADKHQRSGRIVWKVLTKDNQIEECASAIEDDPCAGHEGDDDAVQPLQQLDVPWSNHSMVEDFGQTFDIALTGRVLDLMLDDDHLREAMLPGIIKRASVYARMTPEQKAELIQLLKDHGRDGEENLVGMCGDGANDCGALKMADAGVSLSDTEASIAAPFSSKVQDIACTTTLLREGRGCLSMTIQAFKFIEMYALVQFMSVCILYRLGINLTDPQFLWVDLIVLFPLEIFQSLTESASELSEHLPQGTLLERSTILSIVSQGLIQLGFQLLTFDHIKEAETQSSFVVCTPAFQDGHEQDSQAPCTINTAIFLLTIFQYVTLCLCFIKAKPFRKTIWTNRPLLISVLLIACYQTYLLLIYTPSEHSSLFGLVNLSTQARLYLGLAIVANFIMSYSAEALLAKEYE